MATRTRYEVLPTTPTERQATGDRWKFTVDGKIRATHRNKADAVQDAKTVANAEWETNGTLGELKIKGRNGLIQDSRTYGADPVGTKG